MKINPEYLAAPYELRYVKSDGVPIVDQWPHRFNEPWPEDIRPEGLQAWIADHSIPKFLPSVAPGSRSPE